ncbi:MAG: hypothetical protein AAGD25_03070 [Cyanobacteria bacterium P01_F01_bin.150]
MSKSLSMGVYFSANDAVYDWAIAFLNSFREFNPDLRLLLIPFNNQCDRLLELQETYNFEVYTDPSFERLEAIGEAFELGHTPTGPYWFRRYAAFWGPCDRFMYLDARQVVLADLKPIIQALDVHDFELIHFDCALNQVYEPGELRQELLRQGKARGFLSGLWASRKGLFSLEEFVILANEALEVRQQLNPRNTDQAFINYCCDAKPVRYGHAAEVLGNTCHSGWARQSGQIYCENKKYFRWDYGGQDHNKQVILIHWAGYKLSSIMPHFKLFKKFYWKKKSAILSVANTISTLIGLVLIIPIDKLRKNRNINCTYHRLRNILSI